MSSSKSVLDLLLYKEIVYGTALSMEPIISRVAAFLGFEHKIGSDHTRLRFLVQLMVLSLKHYKLIMKNSYYYRALLVRKPTKSKMTRMHELIDLHYEYIHCIDLSFCHEFVTDDAVGKIAKKCIQLRQCVLWGCHQLTDKSIIALAIKCRYLTFLNFGGCFQITDKSLEVIGRELLYLDNLHLSGCKKITNTGIVALTPYSRVILQINSKDKFRIPMEFDLHHMKTQLRMFDCKQVQYREMSTNVYELIACFGSRPKAVSLWCAVDAKNCQSKYVPKLTTFDQEYHYKGLFQCISLKVLNITACPHVTIASTSTLLNHHVHIKILQ
ncbi:hypothetical protein THRCLA_03500 [Thraustotheca clavata]|uniref:F-box/LRR-repeat protein 15-like leucin rich repeat domain-containing protein n=1 Tax=Thraustotheca clavata TaxID=74557 RepID=A0A1W0A1W0_9STRA|nr:hypothetical protein THRCLA_03500 [Thraustotheca clavata]